MNLDPVHYRDAIASFEIARRLLNECGVDRIDIEPRLWIARQRQTTINNVVCWWRPNGLSQSVLIVRENDTPSPPVVRYEPGAWRRLLRKAAADYDASKEQPVEP